MKASFQAESGRGLEFGKGITSYFSFLFTNSTLRNLQRLMLYDCREFDQWLLSITTIVEKTLRRESLS